MLIIRRVILVVVLAASLLAAVMSLGSWRERLLADDLRRQMHTAADAELPGVLRKAATLENDGLPLIAEALGSFRPSLAFAAHDYLKDRIDRIELLSPIERPRHLSKIAHALAGRVAVYGPSARHWSADMADEILRLAPRDATRGREQLLASCERLIRAAAESSGDALLAKRDVNSLPAPDTRQPPTDEARAATFDTDWIAQQLLKNDPLADGDLPLPSVDVPALPAQPPVANSAEPVDDNGRGPRPFPRSDEATPIEDGPARLRRGSKASPIRTRPQLNVPVQIGGESDELAMRAPDVPKKPTSSEPRIELTRLDTRDVLKRWSETGIPDNERAEKELRRRGFTDRDMKLAEKFTDADSAVRRKFAEMLPRISGVRASRWLWWLAEDGDAQVRVAAMSMLATSSDPTVRRRLRELADRESNPSVAGRLRKILAPQRR